MKNIKEKLEGMKRHTLTVSEKKVLWSKIEGGIRAREAYGEKQPTFFGVSTRFVMASLLIVFVLTSGSVATVAAADDAVPGDTLFPVDEAIERIELFFTRQEEKAERRLEFAQERLEEAQTVLALADTDGDDTTTSTDEGEGDGGGGYRSNRVAKAERALNAALGRLEAIREDLVAEGDDEAVAEIDALIEELKALAENHIAFLEGIHDEIEEARDEFREIRDEIKESRDEVKFRFDHRIGDIEDEDGEDRPGRGFGFGRFLGSNENGSHDGHWEKTVLCHIPPGNPDNAHTISVGSPAAVRAHLAHGDTEDACEGGEGGGGGDETTLTIVKVVVNDGDGTSTIEDFTLFVDEDEVDSGEENEFEPGEYAVSEGDHEGYEATFSGDCDSEGSVTLEESDDKTCTITNDDIGGGVEPTTLTVIKEIVNDDNGTSTVEDFTLFVDGCQIGNCRNSYSRKGYAVHPVDAL